MGQWFKIIDFENQQHVKHFEKIKKKTDLYKKYGLNTKKELREKTIGDLIEGKILKNIKKQKRKSLN